VAVVEETFRRHGFDTVRNNPYAGGHTTQLYGRPDRGVHALQIEINRALYMDEKRIERSRSFAELRQRLTEVLSVLARTIEPELFQRSSVV
jgi:N-formylglutamate amidohydrolase